MNLTFAPEITLFPNPVLAKVERVISNNSNQGRVSFQSSQWPARWYNQSTDSRGNEGAIQVNQLVKVIGRQGITLLVVPHLE